MDNLRTGEKIAGAAGIALLLVMFIFDWFSLDLPGGAAVEAPSADAWDSMELIRWVLLVTALSGILLAILRSDANLPVALSAITAGLGILATLLILYRLIDTPNFIENSIFGDFIDPGEEDLDISRELGAFLGLIAAAATAYGGWQAMQEEGTSFGDQRDRLGDRGAPPSSAPPAS